MAGIFDDGGGIFSGGGDIFTTTAGGDGGFDWSSILGGGTSGGGLDWSDIWGGAADTGLGGLFSDTGSLFGNIANASQMGDLWFDTTTGQIMSGTQAAAADPAGYQLALSSQTQALGSQAGNIFSGTTTPPAASSSWFTPQNLAAYLSLGLGAGALAGGIGGLIGGSDPENRTTTQTSSTSRSPMSAEQTSLLGAPGGTLLGTGGTSTQVPGTGLMGLSNQALQNASGLMNLQGQAIGNLFGQSLPQLNPQLAAAIESQALGMAQGRLPALSDPAAQAAIQQAYAPALQAVSYSQGQALDRAKQSLQERGFYAPDAYEGPTMALTAPIMAASDLARAQILGQQAQSGINLALQLPQYGTNLATTGLDMAYKPLNAQLGMVNALNAPLTLQAGIPQDLFRTMESGRSSSVSGTSTAPTPTFAQQMAAMAPLFNTGGQLLNTAGTLFGTPGQT